MGQAIPIGHFVENPEWLRDLLHEQKSRSVIGSTAHKYQAVAVANSPGHGYRGSLAAKSQVLPNLAAESGVAPAWKVTLEPRWHIIEYGNAKYAGVHSPPYAPLRRAAIELGLEWEKT